MNSAILRYRYFKSAIGSISQGRFILTNTSPLCLELGDHCSNFAAQDFAGRILRYGVDKLHPAAQPFLRRQFLCKINRIAQLMYVLDGSPLSCLLLKCVVETGGRSTKYF